MASRKTYFGMGFKDPSDPESGPAAKSEQEDRSAPTIVDDEKVAEGLRQLRSWYQGEDQTPGNLTATPSPPVSTPASSIGGPQARPTAVGHATGPPPSAAQRPVVAPDPMRATMYGHDVHQFDLDLPASGGEATHAASSTALVLADPGSGQHAVTRQAGAVPTAAAWPGSDSFNLARHGGGEAERLQRPAGLRRSSREIRPKTRVPMASRVMFAVGLAALVAAGLFYLGSGNESDAPSVQPGPAPTPALPARPMPPAAVPETPPVVPAVAPPSNKESSPQAPARPLASPTPIPSVTTPKSDRPRTPTTPAALRTPRRPREAKAEAKAADGEGDSSAGATAPAEKEKPAGKPKADADETMPPSED